MADAGLAEVDATLREAHWSACISLERSLTDLPLQTTEAAAAAIRAGLTVARENGAVHAHRLHLLAGLVADPTSRASRVLADLEIDPAALLADPVYFEAPGANDRPVSDGATTLTWYGVAQWRVHWFRRLPDLIRYLAAGRPKLSTAALSAVTIEGIRQAVRLGDGQVGPIHLLLAICAIEHQFQAKPAAFNPSFADQNRAGVLLRQAGIDYPSIVDRVVGWPPGAGPIAGDCPPGRDQTPWRAPLGPWHPPLGEDAAAILDQAAERSPTGTDDVLVALLDDDHGQCARLLTQLDVDTTLLKAQLERR
jgi:hypothetical protein